MFITIKQEHLKAQRDTSIWLNSNDVVHDFALFGYHVP